MLGFKKYNYDSFRRNIAAEEFAKTRASRMAGPKAGQMAPDFEGRLLDGGNFSLEDFRGESNLVLTFGSATCPFTAASIQGLNDLYDDYEGEDVEFLFVYVREAHPGELLPAHHSMEEKIRAADVFRDEEELDFPILVDELDGSVHKAYGMHPNATYLIDKSGRVAFRQLWTRPRVVRAALRRLLDIQEKSDLEHAIVLDGEDTSMPMIRGVLHMHRALERGGGESIRNFRQQMGPAGRLGEAASRAVEPITLHPMRAFAGATLAGAVITGGLLLGKRLRRERFTSLREPYKYAPRAGEGDYAVGI